MARPDVAPVVVVHRDEHLLVVLKPAGLPTTSPDGRRCLVESARALDPRAPRLHPSSRLDADVTGLVTFARTSHAIERLLAARRTGTYGRVYVGLATRAPVPAEGRWTWDIAPDRRLRTAGTDRAAPAGSERAGALAKASAAPPRGQVRHAVSDYLTVAVVPLGAALHLRPRTGRTHQLRVHCAAAGCPLLGDVAYGGPPRVVQTDGRVVALRRPMLHCALLDLPDLCGRPGERLLLRAPVPDDLGAVWSALGGEAASLVPDPA
jgi:23S rRNA-/tRNA-specific pseudouridylate synthase